MNSEWTEWAPSLDVNSSEDVAAFLNAVLELGRSPRFCQMRSALSLDRAV